MDVDRRTRPRTRSHRERGSTTGHDREVESQARRFRRRTHGNRDDEGETKHVKYDDGREVTITEVDE